MASERNRCVDQDGDVALLLRVIDSTRPDILMREVFPSETD